MIPAYTLEKCKKRIPLLTKENKQFYEDIIDGLSKTQKQLPSKYFYDAVGDKLFQDIMNSEDYYVTRSEMEIFTSRIPEMVKMITGNGAPFDLIELGAGDCTKSIHLFRGLLEAKADFTYMPIDISANVISNLEDTLPKQLPGLKMEGLNGEYFQMLQKVHLRSDNRKVILCLGGNIGNMMLEDSYAFARNLRSYLNEGDILIMGFDLKKDPRVIRAAYDDRDGITRQFNLNLLRRINQQLSTDFDVDKFEHYCTYDPETGACKSYLISLADMEVHFPDQDISFKKDECIWMEISQKYTLDQVDDMANKSGFKPMGHLMDSKNWFTDAIWLAR